ATNETTSGGKLTDLWVPAGLRQHQLERLELEPDLRQALDKDQLRVHYQPIHSLSDGQLTELEALVRWERPGHGLMYPSSFIPTAEETGLIVPIGRWVLEQACQQARAWNEEMPLIVRVKLSARQF